MERDVYKAALEWERKCESNWVGDAFEAGVNWASKNQWIPVSERLPPPDEHVLGWSVEIGQYVAYLPAYRHARGMLTSPEWGNSGETTHWMPLPAAPTTPASCDENPAVGMPDWAKGRKS